MKDEKMFNNYMATLGEIFDKKLTKVLTNIYFQALSKFSDEQCKVAFEKIISKSKFFPKPAEILEIMEIPLEYIKQQQVGYFQTALNGFDYRNPPGWDEEPTTRRLLKGRFNLERMWPTLMESDIKWVVKDFSQAFDDMADHVEYDEKVQIEMSPEVKKLTENIG